MFLHVTNQYLVNIVHTTSCLLSLFVLDSSMPTLFYLWFCRNALILLQLLQESCIENLSFFLMVVMPLTLTLPTLNHILILHNALFAFRYAYKHPKVTITVFFSLKKLIYMFFPSTSMVFFKKYCMYQTFKVYPITADSL